MSAPTIEALFRGGPLDGRQLHVNADTKFLEVPVAGGGVVRYQRRQELVEGLALFDVIETKT